MATVRQLEYFLAVVDWGSFTDAAGELGVTQPGLSHQIKAMERGLGGAVLQRAPSGPRLTPLGRAIVPHARATVADLARVHETARSVLGLGAGVVDVATINSISLGVLPHVLREWSLRHPGVTVRLREHAGVDAVLGDLATGQVDVAVTPLPGDWQGHRRIVGREEFVVVVPPDHRLRGAPRVRFEQLAQDPWVHFTADHGLAGVLDHVAERHHFTPAVAMRTRQTAAAVGYAVAGMGPALVPANMVPLAWAHLVLRPEPTVERDVFVVLRDVDDPVAGALADTVVETSQLVPPHLAQAWAR